MDPKQKALGIVFLFLMTLVAYQPTTQGDFIWDDDAHVLAMEQWSQGEALRKIWLEPGSLNQYYPLTYTSFWVENRVWNLNPIGYHFVNIFLHGLNAVLVWLLLVRLSVPLPYLIAAVFAIHPVHAETVAWISERKNVLSGLFYLSALLAYLRFSKGYWREEGRLNETNNPWPFYFISLLLFTCALLSKTVTSTLPATILLLHWWKYNGLKIRAVLLMLPFFSLAAFLGSITAKLELASVKNICEGECDLSFVDSFLVAGRALWF